MIDLDEARRILAEAGWRPIEDRPKTDDSFLLWADCEPNRDQMGVWIGFWNTDWEDHCWVNDDGMDELFPSHWMPIPSPPDTPSPLHALCESLIADNEAQARRIEAMEAENAELKSARRARIAATYLKETPDE